MKNILNDPEWKRAMKWLYRYLTKYKWKEAVGLVLVTICAILNIINPKIMGIIVDDVIFTGHIRFPEILAYYRTASAFVCMSEHEGFCVPLAEAMFFDVPIIAYDAAAISDTLGGCGILLDDNSPEFAAAVIDRTVHDEKLREYLIKGQRERLEDFSYERIKAIFEKQLRSFIEKR